MQRYSAIALAALLLAGTALPAHAQSLLGGVIGGDGALVTVQPGSASDTGLVNLGLGGDSVVDLNVGGGSDPLASANVSTGGGSLLDADVGLLGDTVGVGATVGGDNLLDVDIGIGGPGAAGGLGGPRGAGVIIVPGGNGGFSTAMANNAACRGNVTPSAIAELIRATRVNTWARASNVAVQRIQLCPEVRSWLAEQLASSRVGQALRQAIMGDTLISASLSRTNYGVDRVFAVRSAGDELTVFVY